jgi:hypothetical protein
VQQATVPVIGFLGPSSRGQLRRDLTIELISQLNEIDDRNSKNRTQLHRVVRKPDYASYDICR